MDRHREDRTDVNAPTAFVVRRADGWSIGPIADRVPRDATLAEVLGLLGAADRRRDDAAAPEPLAPGAYLEPVSAFVGRPDPDGLFVEGTGGRTAVLDPVDLALLDRIDGACSAESVVAAHDGPEGEPELLARLRLLCELGRVRLTFEPAPEPEPEPGADGPAEGGEAAGDLASAPTPARLAPRRLARAAVRRARFPGRAKLRAAYLRARGRTPAAAPPPGAPADPDPDPADGPADGSAPAGPNPPADADAPVAEPDQGPALGLAYLDDPRIGPARPGAVPVYAVFKADSGPPLSLGMLTAAARAHDGGALGEVYEIRRPEDPTSMLADLEGRTGPAVLLLSNYLWSVDHNLDVARRAKAANPDLLVVHGGPSTPQYEADVEAFFAEHRDVVDVTVRNEGEVTLCAILTALAPGLPSWELARLAEVTGLSYRDPTTGGVVRTDDRERVADLAGLPSPYLTGEYDHLDPSAWDEAPVILETNRGCPYGCTFCDWGSSTLSRIRKFDLDRVADEMAWAGERGLRAWALADANVGIMSRDVEVADRVAAVRSEAGVPVHLGFNVAKNTTKHLTAIMGRLVEAGVAPHVSLALQTRDEDTLEAVRRTNISTDHYVAMAATFRRHGLPLMADIMLGLPGQTLESLTGDLQFLIDHEVPARIWITQLLPNSPMNDPEYREQWGVVSDENGVVVETSTFDAAGRAAMMRLRYAHTVLERYGLVRHVSRYLQWEHDVPATEVMHRALALADEQPERYPLISWVLRYFDFFHVPPVGWHAFYEEVRRFVHDELGIPPSSGLTTVLELQRFLMPEHGRTVPEDLVLDHDYVQYYRDATRSLWVDGYATGPIKPLESYGPARFTVYGDPMERCGRQMGIAHDPRNENMTEAFWSSGHMELDSPLVSGTAEIAAHGGFIGLHEQVPEGIDLDAPEPVRERRNAIPVQLTGRRPADQD